MVVSVNVESCVVDPGDDEYVDQAWDLKERINQEEGVLKQRRGFFTDAYRRSTVYCYLEDDDLLAFASARRDGYILFLAVAPEYRDHGFGKRLVATVADRHSSVTCHARTTNQNAIEFYQHLGFEIQRRVSGYYEDGGDAYYLRLGEDGLRERISRFMGF